MMDENFQIRVKMATRLLNSQFVKIDEVVAQHKLDVVKGALRIMVTQLGVTADDVTSPEAKFLASWAISE